ncbi:MAG: hypothetical protein AAFQ17_04575 [Pseudomonadota bacterium]
MLAASYATDHSETLPVAGLFLGYGDFGEGAGFENLSPSLRLHQQYWTWGEGDGQRRIMPFSLALAWHGGFDFDRDSRAGMLAASGLGDPRDARPSFMEAFRCPGDTTWAIGDVSQAGATLAYGGGSRWRDGPHIPEMSSYALSEQLLGDSRSSQFEGRVDRNVFPSEHVLLIDGDGRNAWGDSFQTMFVADEVRAGTESRDFTGDPSVFTVQEYYTFVDSHPDGDPNRPSQFELDRHGGALNAGSIDGAVRSVANTPSGRDELALLRVSGGR